MSRPLAVTTDGAWDDIDERSPLATWRGAGADVSARHVEQVAAHALATGLALWRRLACRDAVARLGAPAGTPAPPVTRLVGARVAVLGSGAIEHAVARRWRALGVEVVADPRGAELVSAHLPLTDSTRGLLGDRVFDAVWPGAVVVDCGGPGVLDLDAAVRALDDGRLSGLALDVHPHEPAPADHPLLARADVLLTPRVADRPDGSLTASRTRAALGVVTELRR